MECYTSRNMRADLLFTRNQFDSRGEWGIPLVKRQELSTEKISLIACSDTRNNDTEKNKKCGVHFFCR